MTTIVSQITLRLFTEPFIQTQIKENMKAPRHWLLCGEFTGTGEFPAQRASYAKNVSIWWRHHGPTKNSRDYYRMEEEDGSGENYWQLSW